MVAKIKNFYEHYWEKRLRRSSFSGVAHTRFNTILQLLPKSFSKVLDVGCGDGTTLSLLKKYYGPFQALGFDISKRAVQAARSKGIDALVHNAEDPFPFRDNFFDVVICSEVLEHLIFPDRCIREIYRVLKSEGIAIFSIPNLGFIKNRLKLLLGISPCEQGRFCRSEHLHYWTCNSFRLFLKKYGFLILTIKGIKPQGYLRSVLVHNIPCLFSDYIFFKARK